MYVCVCVYMCIYVYTHTHTCSFPASSELEAFCMVQQQALSAGDLPFICAPQVATVGVEW